VTASLTVRDATAEDLHATAAIIATDVAGEVEDWCTRFAEALADSTRLFMVAEVEGVIVGFGHARFVARDPAGGSGPPGGWYLSGVTVAPEYRRRGIGLALTTERLKRLRGEVVHYAAEPENMATIALHERLGFAACGPVTLPGQDRQLVLFRRQPDGG
jgi:ribosomal protein S18 acetylase RimI-like enzyme